MSGSTDKPASGAETRPWSNEQMPQPELLHALRQHAGDFGLHAPMTKLPACAELPYLRDLARLEAARTHAYHAADVTPLGPDVLARLTPETLGGLRLALHPAVAIIDLRYPIVTIWAMNSGERPLAEITDWQGEAALISRPEFDVEVRALPPGGAAFLTTLAGGATLSEAAEAAQVSAPDFDLALNLAALFSTDLVSQISPAFEGQVP